MQIRCYHCHRPFAIGKENIHQALDILTQEGLTYYNAYCPHCRRANRISIEELRRAAPEWVRKFGQERQPIESVERDNNQSEPS